MFIYKLEDDCWTKLKMESFFDKKWEDGVVYKEYYGSLGFLEYTDEVQGTISIFRRELDDCFIIDFHDFIAGFAIYCDGYPDMIKALMFLGIDWPKRSQMTYRRVLRSEEIEGAIDLDGFDSIVRISDEECLLTASYPIKTSSERARELREYKRKREEKLKAQENNGNT
jgi:hypothetical protein